MVIEKIKRHKAQAFYKIPAIRYEIHKLIKSVGKKEDLQEEWKESIIVRIYQKSDKSGCSNYRGISICQLRTKFHPTFCYQN